MAEPNQSFTVFIPGDIDPAGRKLLGNEMIRFIKSRTKKGLDINGRPFKGYSKVYKESLDFKNAGKTDKVNLRLTGEMTNSLVLRSHGPGFLRFALDDVDENDKAFWNLLNGRNFMGISEADKNMILRSFAALTQTDQQSLQVAEAVAEAIAQGLVGNDG